jgi:hypothetical protein
MQDHFILVEIDPIDIECFVLAHFLDLVFVCDRIFLEASLHVLYGSGSDVEVIDVGGFISACLSEFHIQVKIKCKIIKKGKASG